MRRRGVHLASSLSALCLLVVMAAPPATRAAAGDYRTRPAVPTPYVDTIPPPRDVPRPGVIKLHVDATDTARGIYRVREEIPVSGRTQTLFYPAWQPGAHSIQNPVKEMAGLRITANGKTLAWRRDPVQVYAFQFAVPDNIRSVTVEFDYLSPAAPSYGKIQTGPGITWIEWSRMMLYPAETYTRRIVVEAEARIPRNYEIKCGLDPVRRDGDLIHFPRTDVDTLFDSPALSGAFLRIEYLTPRVELDVFSATEDQTPVAPEVLAALKRLPLEALALFGVEHYSRYKFLAAQIEAGPVLEHHTSSQLRYARDYFSKPFSPGSADMLPHEFIHSWNGKSMRPSDLWTPNYQVPMRGSGLWVYEGLTEFYGMILAVRSGLMRSEDALEMIAAIAAQQNYQRGRDWKSVADTTLDSASPLRRPLAWTSYQRQEDFYFEGVLIWLEVDSIIRRQTRDARSLDDFAKTFFGGLDGDATDHTYQRADVVRTLRSIAPYDWNGYFRKRIDETGPVPMAGIENGGYDLTYSEAPNSYINSFQARFGAMDFSFSLGLSLAADGTIADVVWGGPAFQAGLRTGSKVRTINGKPFVEKMAVAELSNPNKVGIILLSVDTLGRSQTVAIKWSGGVRFPHLKTKRSPRDLDRLFEPKVR